MILITTTRRPSRRTRSFIRDLYCVIPTSKKMNRGKMSMRDLNELAIKEGVERVVVVGTQRGNPSSLAFYEPSFSHLKLISLIKLNGVTLRREITDKRAPYARRLGIVYSHEDLGDKARILARSFKTNILSQSLERLRAEVESCEVAFLLSSNGGMRGTFYKVRPSEELGPRMRISEIREYGEGIDDSEDRVWERS
ncbi:MAG: hypothetical protein NZ992_06125 [Candidatus Korarchaeum sp.]|nr:hypothetical protein [Candidatus Korarchaeum sp.]MDW8036148.1 hypothetical protein [Candidatus Korarchaeum sp.]